MTMLSQRILLLQPEEVLHARIESIPEFAQYIEQAQAIIQPHLNHLNEGFIVLAVRADGEQRFWFDFNPSLAIDVQLMIHRALKKLFSFDVYDGVILVALQFYQDEPQFIMPNPIEWQNANKVDGMSLEDLVLNVWS